MIEVKAQKDMPGFLRILVAEDDEVDAFVIQCELSKLDVAYTFKRVSSQRDFLQQIEEFAPNLIIANYAFGGLSTLAQARQKCPEVPFISIVTGGGHEGEGLDQVRRSGATDLIFKNQIAKLVGCVERIIGMGGSPAPQTRNSPATGETPKVLPVNANRQQNENTAALPHVVKNEPVPARKSESSVAERLARIKAMLTRPPAPLKEEAPPENSHAIIKMDCGEADSSRQSSSDGFVAPSIPEISTKAPSSKPNEESVFAADSSIEPMGVDGPNPECARLEELFDRYLGDDSKSFGFPDSDEPEAEAPAIFDDREGTRANPSSPVVQPPSAPSSLASAGAGALAAAEAEDLATRTTRLESQVADLEKELESHLATREALEKSKKAVEQKLADRSAELKRLTEQLRGEIGERRNLDRARNQAEALFRALFDASLDAAFIVDNSGACLQVNPAGCSLMGLSHGELAGRALGLFATNQDDPLSGTAWKAFLERGDQRGECVFKLPDGAPRDIEYQARVHFIADRHLIVIRDVTTRKRHEEELRALHERLEKNLASRSSQLQTSQELENKIASLRRTEESLLKTKDELQAHLTLKTAELKDINELLRLEMINRKRVEEESKIFYQQLEKRVADRTAQLEAANNELRLLSRYLQTSREEERRRVLYLLNDELSQFLVRIKIDLGWVTQRLSQTDEGLSRRQLMELICSLTQLVESSQESLSKVSKELSRWASRTTRSATISAAANNPKG